MSKVYGFLLFAAGVFLGVEAIYVSHMRLVIWFVVLTSVSILWARKTGRVASGVVAGLSLWSVALVVFFILLASIRWPHELPITGEEVLVAFTLLITVGGSVSWICSWSTIRFGAWSLLVPLAGTPMLITYIGWEYFKWNAFF